MPGSWRGDPSTGTPSSPSREWRTEHPGAPTVPIAKNPAEINPARHGAASLTDGLDTRERLRPPPATSTAEPSRLDERMGLARWQGVARRRHGSRTPCGIIGCRTDLESPGPPPPPPPPRNPHRWIPDRHRLSPAAPRRPDRSGAPAPFSPSDAAGVPSADGASPFPTDPTGGPFHPGVAATGVRTSPAAGLPSVAASHALNRGSRAASLRRPHRDPARPETTVPTSGTRSTHR